MKASALSVVFTSPGEVKLLGDAEALRHPTPTEICGRTVVSLVSSGTELAMFSGANPPPYPFYPGYAALFEVEQVGSEIDDVIPGNLVLCLGPHRSHQLVERNKAVVVPDGLAPEVAVLARIISIAITSLQFVKARPGEEVLVMGLGLVGNLASQVFRACGYRVKGYDTNISRRRLAASFDIEVLSDLEELNCEKVLPALVLECSGTSAGFQNACRFVRIGGEVVMVGLPPRVDDNKTTSVMHEVFCRQLTITSGLEWRLPLFAPTPEGASIIRNIKTALDWLMQSRISTEGVAKSVSPFQVAQAFVSLHSQDGPLSYIFDWREARDSHT
jgi:threonine dehydrogenase-like Zn-dependent dehydrogenase